jgi:hypothetical protein
MSELTSRVRRLTTELGVSQRGKIVFKTAAATIGLNERTIKCTANTATDSYTLTLPSVSDAMGMIFSFSATIANAKVITVAHAGDSENWTNLTLDTDNDRATLYSNGVAWCVIENAIA